MLSRPRSPKHQWRSQDRIILSVFYCFYNNHIVDMALVFNHINHKILTREGFTYGIPATSLTAQFHEYQRGGTGSSEFEEVRNLSLREINRVFRSEIRIIEQAAKTLSIVLFLKSSNSFPPRPQSAPGLNTGEMTETSITTWMADSNEEEDYIHVYTPTRSQRRAAASNLPGLDSFLSTMSSTDGQRRPRLLFRAYEVTHGLKARRFLVSDTIPTPPRFVTQDFESEVRPHLNRDKTYSSPFLSFTQNPAVSLKHAFLKIMQGIVMAFAIVRYDDLRVEASDHYGADSGPYLVPTVCKQHELWDLPGMYTGTGEFLVWGSVKSEPVAIINSTNALMIRAILRTMTKVNYDAGVRLGRYLPTMNEQTRELFLFQLVNGFKVPGRRVARTSQAWLDFIRGASSTHHVDRHATADDFIVISDSEEELSNESFVMVEDWRSDTE